MWVWGSTLTEVRVSLQESALSHLVASKEQTEVTQLGGKGLCH